ncbi:Hsp33 family molecular chaperone [Rhodoblastus sp.]|uniref:Hsp33 family molecular chaperone n=1 Tax=Rhodoblastus sp. TaxID=1962975 RepID=UPI003F95D8BD
MTSGSAGFVAEGAPAAGQDDAVLPFAVEPLDLRGRLARLGPALDSILTRHAYPEPVARLLAEAAALTVLLGSVLKSGGRFQLQTRSDGPVDMIVVDFDAPDRLRAFARFDAARLPPQGSVAAEALLGRGHLALTVEQGGEITRYQGVAPIDGGSLEQAAKIYFQQSEQIPTFIRLAAGQVVTPAGTAWRAGGLLAQFLPHSEERRRQADFPPGDAPEGVQPHHWSEDDALGDSWTEAQALAATVEDHELLDPGLSSEGLAYRLFHERGVVVFPAHPLRDSCRCSNERVESMLRGFSQAERDDMVGEDGMIGVTCEFCSTLRRYDPKHFRKV